MKKLFKFFAIFIVSINIYGVELINDDFSTGEEGWTGDGLSENSGWLKINKDKTATKTFDFGSSFADQELTFDIIIKVPNAWEDGWQSTDYFKIEVNDIEEASYSYTGGEHTESFTANADSNGRVVVKLNPDSTNDNEYAEIDYIKISGTALSAEYNCDGEEVLNIHEASGDASKNYITGEDIDENSRYFKFATAVDGEITIRQQNNKAVRGYYKHKLLIGTGSCGNTNIYNGGGSKDDSKGFSVTASTIYFIRVKEGNSRNVLNFDISFNFTATTTTTNSPPTANAGTDQTINYGESVTLSGSGTDSDGTIHNYSWSDGSIVANPTITNLTTGLNVFILTVTDNDGATATDSVTITVNSPPIANAGDDQTIIVGNNVTLDGSGSSDVEDTIAYEWRTGNSIYSGETPIVSGLSVGTYTFTLTVEDSNNATATDTVIITVEEDCGCDCSLDINNNSSPGKTITALNNLTTDTITCISGSSKDEIADYYYFTVDANGTLDINTSSPNSHIYHLKISSSENGDEYYADTKASNHTIPTLTLNQGDTVYLYVKETGYDTDKYEIIFDFKVQTMQIVENADDLCYEEVTTNGFCTNFISVACKITTPITNQSSLELTEVNTALGTSSLFSAFGDCGVNNVSGNCEDASEKSVMAFSLFNRGINYRIPDYTATQTQSTYTSAMFSFLDTPYDWVGTYVKDNKLYRGEIYPCNMNQAPIAVNDSYTTDYETEIRANAITNNDTDNEGDTLTISSFTNPSSGTLTINNNGDFTYTPNNNFSGSDSFTYSITDSDKISNIATVNITVNPHVNSTPIITSNGGGDSANISVSNTDTIVTTVIATDADGDTIIYSINGTDSNLFNINSSSGELTLVTNGTTGDTYSVTVIATDPDGASDSQTLTITISGSLDEPSFSDVCGIFDNVLTSYDSITSNGNNDKACYTESISYPAGQLTGDISCDATSCNGGNSCLQQDPPDDRYTHGFLTNSKSGSSNGSNPTTLQDLEYGDMSYTQKDITLNPQTTYSDKGTKIMLLGDITIAKSTLNFKAGDYYFDSLTIDSNNNDIKLPSSGIVRLFIKGDLSVSINNLDFNTDGNESNIFVYVQGDFISLGKGGGTTNWKAFMYVKGEVTLNNNSNNWKIYGGITAEGKITIDGNNPDFIQRGNADNFGLGECHGCLEVGFERSSYEVSEDIRYIGTETFTNTKVILSRAVNYDVTVKYSTIDGTATASNRDYRRRVEESITIRATKTEATLPIGIYNDAPIELYENFFVQLSDPQPSDKVCLSDINRTEIQILEQTDAPVCFEDNFDNGLDSKWRVLRSRGGFTPKIVTVGDDNRLRLTDNARDLATTITKDYEFETSENLIIVEFKYHAYGGCGFNGGVGTYGADGIVNILFDSTVGTEPVPGGSGGSMGYAQYKGNTPGFEGGWLGMGIDEYGNFSNPTEERIGGTGFKINAIAIRGDGEGMNGYKFLAGAENLSPPVAAKLSDHLSDYNSGKYKMTIDARDSAHLYIRLERDIEDGNGYQILISQFDAKDAQYGQGETPEKVRYAISSGTGGGCNNHELTWISLKGNCAPYGTPPETGPFDAWDTFRHTSPTAPTDRNISTKIIEKEFDISLVSLNSDRTGYELKTGVGEDVEVAIYQPNGTIPISNNYVNFDASIKDQQESKFTVSGAYKEAVVGFKICATNEINETTSQYIYRLWPHSSCSGQINNCTASTENGKPTWHICYSSDSFAIRPENFDISNLPSDPIIAGQGYNVTYKADGYDVLTALGYNERENSSFQVVTELNPAKAGCANQNIDQNSSILFRDGIHDGDLNNTFFNTVGEFNLTIQEIDGSEFARVDADDTPISGSENRFITPFTVERMTIIPSGFNLTSNFTNANSIDNFTYLHDLTGIDKSMSSNLNISIQAIIADGTDAENYESDCYADITDLYVDYNYTDITPIGSLSMLQYDKENSPTESGTDSISTNSGTDDNNGNFIIEDFPATLFGDTGNGSANINLAINFDRVNNSVVNPFNLTINDINLTEDDLEVTAGEEIGIFTTYFFAKSMPSQPFYNDVISNSVKTPISILAYCDLGYTDCTAFGIDTLNGQINQGNWWLSTAHNGLNGDGSVALVKGSIIEGIDSSASVTAVTDINSDATDRNITVARGTGDLPFTLDIDLDTGTSPWLIYNRFAPTNPTPFYRVNFIDGNSNWAGVGKSGNVLDNTANNKTIKRLDW